VAAGQLIVDHLAWLGDTPERRRRELRQFYVTSFGACAPTVGTSA
jgi:hypothetical protein